MAIESINPATGRHRQSFAEYSAEKVGRIIGRSHEAWLDWREVALEKRAALMRRMAGVLRNDKDRCARLMAEEMGKPVSQGRAEMEKCAWVCEHYADHAAEYLADETHATSLHISLYNAMRWLHKPAGK